MPVDSQHPEYQANIAKWTRCRDAAAGDDAIKAAGRKYLPQIDPTQTRDEYHSYLQRATYFEAVARTVESFTGAITRRPHSLKLPDSLEFLIDDVTASGVSMAEFAKHLCAEVLLIGRAGILVDYTDGPSNRPLLRMYTAEEIINWDDDSVILLEAVYEPDPLDRFKKVYIDQIRELSMVDGVYTVQLWRKVKAEWVVHEAPTPTARGKPLDAIPFVWVSYFGATAQIPKPPLLGLVNLALAHYRLGADLAHGLHFCAIPSFYVTGQDQSDEIRLGAATALILKDPNARAGYAEFSGAGLGAIERAIAVKTAEMAASGAAIFGAELRKSETAEAARIRHGGETSLMMGAVSAAQVSLEAALVIAAAWKGSKGDISVSLNDDFISERLDAQTLQGLVAAYQSGALTLESFLRAMQDGDLLPLKAVIADEVAKLRGAA